MNNIAKIRSRLGISQGNLALQLGWSQPRVANYETGFRQPTLQAAQALVKKFNELGQKVSFEDVFPSET